MEIAGHDFAVVAISNVEQGVKGFSSTGGEFLDFGPLSQSAAAIQSAAGIRTPTLGANSRTIQRQWCLVTSCPLWSDVAMT